MTWLEYTFATFQNITSLPKNSKERNQFSKLSRIFSEVGQTRYINLGHVSAAEKEVKVNKKCRTNSPTYLFLKLVQKIQGKFRDTSPKMMRVFNERSGIYINKDKAKPQEKESYYNKSRL